MTRYHLNFELGDDPLVSLREDLAAEELRLERSERSEVKGLVVNREQWLAKMADSRQRIERFKERIAEMEALEPNEAA